MPKVFFTGTTGYIGGDAFHAIRQAHPDWDYVCLVRSEDKGAKVTAHSPNIRLCYGDNDSLDLIEEEASKSDIVIHATTSDEHAPSAAAIVRGLTRREGTGYGYYIHTGGAFALAGETVRTSSWGDRLDNVYDDWDGVNLLTTLPDDAPHRHVDKVVLAADSSKIKTAIVAPSVVYGLGRGPDKKRGHLSMFFQSYWKQKKVSALGKGESVWNNVHIQDLSQIYLSLAEAAAEGGGNATWNEQGYYLAENGKHSAKDMLTHVAKSASQRGLVTSSEVDYIDVAACDKLNPWLKIVIGADSQGDAVRARKLFGWTPRMPKFEDELDDEMQRE